MEEVVLSFGMVEVVSVDADSRFRGAFEAICNFLLITFWPLARGNNKINIIEKYHQLLNKKLSITGQYRGSHDVFILSAKTS